jgi:hypothetical protein
MRQRLPIILSVAALTVAVLGATPLGEAGRNVLLPPNSVGAVQLRSSAVQTRHLAIGAVSGAKVKRGTLLTRHFKAGQIPAGPRGPQGPAGPPGPTTGAATNNGGRYSDVVDIGTPLQITVPTAGKLFVFGRIQALVVCGAAACNRHYEIYVDGTHVPGTLAEVHAPANTTITEHASVFGIRDVSPGAHTIRLRASNSPGVASFLDVLPNVGGIALGG